MQRRLYLVAYDIRHQERLRQMLRVVRGAASGGQKSAYECWLSQSEWQRMILDAEQVMDLAEDSFAMIPLDPRRPLTTLGKAVKPADPEFFYFG